MGNALDRYGLGRPYSSYIGSVNALVWGSPKIKPDLVKRCFGRGLIGVDRHITKDVMLAIQDCSSSELPVMVVGDTGTGKELVASGIHSESPRSGQPFMAVNCAGVAGGVLESLLFGHRKGAFTGASGDHKGFFEQADGGTLFLDEIGDMPSQMQSAVLRVLNDGVVEPVGSRGPQDLIAVDVRVICATNRDPTEELRQDLYHRLSTTRIDLFPLFLRPGDLPLLAYYFVTEWNRANVANRIQKITNHAVEELMLYRWPGNAREMKNIIDRACSAAQHRERNCDVIAGLDVLHSLPERGANIESGKLLMWPARVLSLQELRSLDSFDFMEDADRYVSDSTRKVWQIPAKLRVLEQEILKFTNHDTTNEHTPNLHESEPATAKSDLEVFLKIPKMDDAAAAFKRAYVERHLMANDGNQTRTAESIGVNRKTIAAIRRGGK
jgi:DNA-binding NtrC family response regulator